MKIRIRAMAVWAALAALAATGCTPRGPKATPGDVAEYAIAWPDRGEPPRNNCDPKPGERVHAGSTHEIAFDSKRPGDLWISGQNYDWLARVTPGTGAMRFVPMPAGSGPHGLEFDAAGRLWVSLECAGRLIALDAEGHQVAEIRLPAGTRPHGLGIGPDGRTIWYTGKTDGTIGRVAPDGRVTRFVLKDPASTPIYIRAGPDGSMWATELTGNRIARVTPDGRLVEYDLMTPNSRPIAIVPGPDGAMWFSEEAGNEVGRIDAAGIFTTFVLPDLPGRPNLLLAGLAFDGAGDLWVQQYVDPNHPAPAGEDYLVRLDRAALKGPPQGFKPRQFERTAVPTRATVMHRVIRGPDGAMWFTEMHSDKMGRLAVR
jgi:virginiamycin B lyase